MKLLTKHVEDRVRKEFCESDQAKAKALDIIRGYTHPRYDVERVINVALDLAEGNLEELEEKINVAKRDYRDVLIADRSPEEVSQSKFIIYGFIVVFILAAILRWLDKA